jgi:hypothetical protein
MQAVARVLLLPSTVWLTPLLCAFGAVFGVAGTLTLKLNHDAVDLVFSFYLISNIAWTTAAIRSKQLWLLLMNLSYLAISLFAVGESVLSR